MAGLYRYFQKPINILRTDLSTNVSNHHFIHFQTNIVISTGKIGGMRNSNWDVLKTKNKNNNSGEKSETLQATLFKSCRYSATV